MRRCRERDGEVGVVVVVQKLRHCGGVRGKCCEITLISAPVPNLFLHSTNTASKVHTLTPSTRHIFQYLESDGDRSNSNTELPSRRARWCTHQRRQLAFIKAALPRKLEIIPDIAIRPSLGGFAAFYS